MDAHEVIAKLGMFWAQGHSDKLRQGAGAHRQMATDLGTVQAACQSATDLVCTQNQGPPIDGFSTYWSKWQTDPGYFPATIQASNQLAEALDAYAQKIDEAHHHIIELATAAAVALGVGLLLTVFTFGGSDAAAGVTVAGLVAASFAEATGLSAAIATIVVGVGVGALEGMVFDGIVQVEATDVFHDQKDFNWAEFGESAAFGAVTGGLGAGAGLGLARVGTRLLPTLTDAVPVLGRTINALDKIPAPVRDGGIGLVTGTGFAAGIDEITTGQINPDDLLIGGLAGLAGGAIAGARGARPGGVDPGAPQTDAVPTITEPAPTPPRPTIPDEVRAQRLIARTRAAALDQIRQKGFPPLDTGIQNTISSEAARYGVDPQQFEALARDPDHANNVNQNSIGEAKTVLTAERLGVLQDPIRDPNGADFLDARAQQWDVKTPHSGPKFDAANEAEKMLAEVNDRHENVLVNADFLTNADETALRQALAARGYDPRLIVFIHN